MTRKRDKGRARRAKAETEAAKAEKLKCLHGAPLPPPEGHACCNFLETLTNELREDRMAKWPSRVDKAIAVAAQKNPEVLRNDSHRKLIKAQLVAMGVCHLLHDCSFKYEDIGCECLAVAQARDCACAIMKLDPKEMKCVEDFTFRN